jgi:hypothetical protein
MSLSVREMVCVGFQERTKNYWGEGGASEVSLLTRVIVRELVGDRGDQDHRLFARCQGPVCVCFSL